MIENQKSEDSDIVILSSMYHPHHVRSNRIGSLKMNKSPSSSYVDDIIFRQKEIIKIALEDYYLHSDKTKQYQIYHVENMLISSKVLIGMEDCLMSENEDFDELEIEEEENSESPVIETKVPTAKTPTGSRITLFFRSTIGPGEKLEKLTVDPEMAVLDLKETLGGIFGLDPQDFHLSISGRTLDADDVLSNYDLEEGLECLIIPVSTAG